MRRKTTISFLLRYKIKIGLCIFLTIVLSFVAPYKSFALQWMIDASGIPHMFQMLLLGGSIFVLSFVTEWLSRAVFVSINNSAAHSIRKEVVRNLLRRDYKTYNDEHTGSYIALLMNDLRTIQDDYFQGIYNILLYGGMLLFALIFLLSINPIFLLVILIMGVFPICLPRLFAKRLKKTKADTSNQIAKYSGFLKEVFEAFDVIRVFGVLEMFSETFYAE